MYHIGIYGGDLMEEFLSGCRRSLPIALGYFPVSFSFGVFVASSGLPLGLATLISITNLTSSGQFAGVSLMLVQASYMETALTLLMINARYFLMSLSLSQKIDQKMSTLERMVISFGITDETFSLASLEQKTLSFPFMSGFILIPIIGWTSGTLAGETLTNLLPASLQNAMGLALYGMFLAIIIPASSKSRAIGEVVLLAAILSTLMYVTPLFQELSSGFQLIIATLLAALYGAWRYPIEEKE